MKEVVRATALQAGFDLCGFAPASTPVESAQHLATWLAEGMHGTMVYLSRTAQKRADVRQLMRGARTVIAVAASYWVPAFENTDTAPPPGCGRVARYARFDDYHEVLGRALARLTDKLARLTGNTAWRWYVDTGPLLERAYAWAAGIGFVGKNTNLINPRIGPWLVLGEILTELELEPDRPEPTRCGSCTRCLQVCPTGALIRPYLLDARKCIAYLTIEHRGGIPEPLRPVLGHNLFGCDVCIGVCPWAKFSRQGQLMAGHFRSELAYLDLAELLELTPEEFSARFTGTPMAYAGHWRMLRNACIAAGNSGVRALIPLLDRLASGSDAVLAEHARWAITRLSTSE